MATIVARIGGAEYPLEEFLGTDFELEFAVLLQHEDTAVNIAQWTLSWMVKKRLAHPDADAVLVKTTTSGIVIAGSWHADPDLNEQRATLTVADADTESLACGDYFWGLKRMDNGAETVLAYGTLTLIRSVHHA